MNDKGPQDGIANLNSLLQKWTIFPVLYINLGSVILAWCMWHVDGDDQVGLVLLETSDDHDHADEVKLVIPTLSGHALLVADLAESYDDGNVGAASPGVEFTIMTCCEGRLSIPELGKS